MFNFESENRIFFMLYADSLRKFSLEQFPTFSSFNFEAILQRSCKRILDEFFGFHVNDDLNGDKLESTFRPPPPFKILIERSTFEFDDGDSFAEKLYGFLSAVDDKKVFLSFSIGNGCWLHRLYDGRPSFTYKTPMLPCSPIRTLTSPGSTFRRQKKKN